MATGPSLIGHRPLFQKSNTELINSLRTAFTNAKSNIQESSTLSNGTSQPVQNGTTHSSKQIRWTSTISSTLHIPSPLFSAAPLAEERSSYDITLKLFFLPSAKSDAKSRTAHAQEALRLVLTALDVPNVDLLIVSFPGISFDADDDPDADIDDELPELGDTGNVDNADGVSRDFKIPVMPKLTRTLTAEDRLVDSIVQTWRGIESLHSQSLATTLGVAEFGSERLERFLPLTTVRPSVDQINVRDCCVVPKPLILYAKNKGIQLLTHNDCTDILPPGTVRDILENAFSGGDDDGDARNRAWLKADIVPQWVVKYTAVVRDRGVIENKGYFAMAEVAE